MTDIMSRYEWDPEKYEHKRLHHGSINDWVWGDVAEQGMAQYGYTLRHEVFVHKFGNDPNAVINDFNELWAPHNIEFDMPSSERAMMPALSIVIQELDELLTLKRNKAYFHLLKFDRDGTQVNLAHLGLTKTKLLGEIVHACQDPRMQGKGLMLAQGLRSQLNKELKNVHITVITRAQDAMTLKIMA
jgi:hypothetical protein